MFISNRNELEQFVSTLLQTNWSEQIHKILNIQDQKQLLYAKNVMIQKMPKQLISSKFIPRQQLVQKQNIINQFPSMFQNNEKKTYEYVNENIQNMKKIASTYNNLNQFKIMPQAPSQKLSKQQPIFNIEMPDKIIDKDVIKQGIIEKKIQSVKGSGSAVKSQNNGNISFQSNRFFSQSVKKNNPFVANNMNFTDLHANSKSIHNKYPHINFSQHSRNITAIAQSTKHQAFSESVAFPTTVMSGNLMPPKNNTFSKQTKLDVTDIMRYTLGRTKQNTKNTSLENPFARVPKKRQ